LMATSGKSETRCWTRYRFPMMPANILLVYGYI